jgi:hypothetical protein
MNIFLVTPIAVCILWYIFNIKISDIDTKNEGAATVRQSECQLDLNYEKQALFSKFFE